MPSPVPTPRPCPVVPGYVLEELIGRGGTGEVWRARPRGDGPPVAIKVLVRGDPERQVREAALLAELDHPHLVRLHQVVRRRTPGGGEQVALVLDLLAGGSLAALLAARGRLRPGEVVTAIAPVAAALAHVHDHGIVHGDLSPGNVVLTAEGRPVLTDLGVARVLGEPGADEVTPPYVDPVVARGGAPGPGSDVFGVAAAAFHALTGIPPWNAAGPGGTLAVAASGQLPDLALLAPEAPAELVAVVSRGLSPVPHLRGSAAEFALDLRHACRPERIAMPAPGVDPAALHRTGHVPRTELTHQVRRAPRAHAAPAAPGRWARCRGRFAQLGPAEAGGFVRRAAAGLGVAAAVLAAVWVGVQWGSPGPAPVPAARTQTAPGGEPTPTAADAAAESVPPSTAPPTEPPTGRPTQESGGSTTDQPPEAAPTPAPLPAGQDSADPVEQPADAADWAALVGELYERRATAFTRSDGDALTSVFAAGSPLLDVDVERLAQLAADGQRLEGFAPVVVDVERVEAVPGGVRLVLTDRVPGYDVVSDGGRLTLPERAARTVEMVLRSTATGWRIAAAAFAA